MPAVSSFVSNVTQDRFIPTVVDNIWNGNVLTMRLMRSPKSWRGSTQIIQPVWLVKPTTGGWYSGFDSFTTTQETKTVKASIDPSQAYWNVTLNGIQLATNSGDAAVIDLVADEMNNATEAIKQMLGDAVYSDGTGTSNKELIGLQAAVDDSTSITTYANISRSTYTDWKATRTAQSGSLSLANFAADFDAAQVGNDSPTIIVTTPAVFTIYEALLTPTVSHQFSMNDFRMTGDGIARVGGALAANQGFRALTFRGIPVVADEKCTSGNIYTLNENYLSMFTLPAPREFNRKEYKGFQWTGFKEPVNQDAIAGQLIFYGQMFCSSPRKQARRTGVTS